MADEERCEDTGLVASQCACNDHRGVPPDCEFYNTPRERSITGRFKVRWGAKCNDCGDSVLIDQIAAYTNRGQVVCSTCADVIDEEG